MKTTSVPGLLVLSFLMVAVGGGIAGASSPDKPPTPRLLRAGKTLLWHQWPLAPMLMPTLTPEEPGSNYGGDPALVVNSSLLFGTPPRFRTAMALLRFPVAEALPPDALIQSAYLSLYLVDVNCTGADASIGAYRVKES